jgi:hypothetical protein
MQKLCKNYLKVDMTEEDSFHMFVLDLVGWIKAGASKAIMRDLEEYFPYEHKLFIEQTTSKPKQIAALLGGPKGG